MNLSNTTSKDLSPSQEPGLGWRSGSLLGCTAAAILAVAVYVATVRASNRFAVFTLAALAVLLGLAVLHAYFLRLAQRQQRQTAHALDSSEREFHSVFENALDTILLLDDQAIVREANPAAESLLGTPRRELIGQPLERFFGDRSRFERSWRQLLGRRYDRGRAEMILSDGSQLYVEFTAKCDALPGAHLIVARDVTARHRAEEEVGRNLALARAAWSEADALRDATLALTQDLRMDNVLHTLLRSLRQLVPFASAQVWLVESELQLFLASASDPEPSGTPLPAFPATLDAADYPLMAEVLTRRTARFVPDTASEARWRGIGERSAVRSWIAIPLVSSGLSVGILSLGHPSASFFTEEHLRRAESLAIPAAVAIQNARLHQRAEIYSEELERRLSELHQAKLALEQAAKKDASGRTPPRYH